MRSTEAFLEVLAKSKLLADSEMEKVRAAAADHDDAKSLAKALVAGHTLTRWQAAQLLAGRASFKLGKYRLIQLLSRGGMGSVFVAEHTTMSRRVALKIISKQMGRDPAKLERFLAEARTIAALDHANIVRAYDVDHEGERYFLVMEYVEGRDLQQMVEDDGPLDFSRAADYIRQAACGLAHAHERSMIHRDIKPANLIINRQNVVKILDLGMARLIAEGASESDADEKIIGTVDYMSPEQALESEDLDHRADIYSLGCTFYFLLTGRPPFGEGTLPQRIMKHQTQNPPPISQYRDGAPEELDAICRRMMAKKPEDRYPTAADVALALAPWSAPSGGDPAADASANGARAAELLDNGGKQSGTETGIKIIVADSGSFRARTAPDRGHRAAAATKTAQHATSTSKLATVLAGLRADPKRKWIAILSAGVLLLGVFAGGLVWMLGGERTRATADASAIAGQDGAVQTAVAALAKPVVLADPTESESGMKDLGSAFAPGSAPSSGNGKSPAAVPPPGEPEGDEKATESVAADPAPGPKQPESGEVAAAGSTTPAPQAETGVESKPAEPATATGTPEAGKPAEPEAAASTQSEGEDKGEGEKKNDEKTEPQQTAAEDPLADFPDTVDLPALVDNDPAGEKSRAPLEIGAIRGQTSPWQLILLGGETALKGGRRYVLSQTGSESAKATWAIHMESAGTGAAPEQTPVAKLWRNENALVFQWDDKAQAITANYLRNCILQPRVGGKTKFTALTEPLKAEPISLDLLRGMGGSSAALRWAPDDEQLRVKFDGVDGWEGARFEPSEPVPPKTRVILSLVRKDRHANESVGAAFQILATARKTSTNVELRLVNPEPRAFKMMVGNSNEQQVGVARDRLNNRRGTVEASLARLKGEEANKASRELDTLLMQIWYYDLLLQVHNKALLHYKIVTDVGGQEVVLVTTR
ncbi:MAG: protein kinase domain-containing protein [Thermoguttaceae bacterium]|jgi:tRNA A-37 threonylcarbamoyl transferase component Bud32